MALTLDETFLAPLQQVESRPRLELSHVAIESKLYETPLGGAYLGKHLGLDVPVIVRVLRPSVKAVLKDFSKFLEETRRFSAIRHSHIVGVLDVGEFQDHAFMVLEYVSGVPLLERIKSRPLTEAQALALLIPIAEGLAELWRNGLVHRGVSPHIIFIQQDGTAKLDLTVLRKIGSEPQIKAVLAPNYAPYWSPEENRGEAVDQSSDMWSFGATLYHAVTGKTPYPLNAGGAPNDSDMLADPIPARQANPAVREPIEQLLMRLLSRNSEDRFASADSFLSALYGIQAQVTGRPPSSKTILMTDAEKTDAAAASPAPLGPNAMIGNCKIVRKIGAGAFGVVFLARHKVLDLDVAVKVLPVESAWRDPNFVDMFLREARTAARIRHRNVIGIYEAGKQDMQHYIIMELAPGGTVLEKMLAYGGKLPSAMVQRILLEAARGLAAAEQLGIVHRDIKPDNLMFSADGEIKIADLGLAKRLIPPNVTETIRASLAADQLSMKSDPGMLAGTPAYMAPEIAVEPDKIDTRADLYSLGITGFHMLTGKLPYSGKSPMEVIMKHVLDAPVNPRETDPAIPADLAAVILRLMQKKPDQRFQSAAELVKTLDYLNIAEGLMATF